MLTRNVPQNDVDEDAVLDKMDILNPLLSTYTLDTETTTIQKRHIPTIADIRVESQKCNEFKITCRRWIIFVIQQSYIYPTNVQIQLLYIKHSSLILSVVGFFTKPN